MLYVLDTSAILAHYRQEAGWEPVQRLFDDTESDLLAASITLTELGRRLIELGACEQETAQAIESYEQLLSEVTAVDARIAKAAFTIGCRTPHRLPLADALIAATAQVREGCLVHRDQHMRDIPHNFLQQLDLELPRQ